MQCEQWEMILIKNIEHKLTNIGNEQTHTHTRWQ